MGAARARAAAGPGGALPRAHRGDRAGRCRPPARGPRARGALPRGRARLRNVRTDPRLRRDRPGEPPMSHPYTFDPLPQPAVTPGEFAFAAVGLDHGHIFGMTDGLIGAGATVTWVFDENPERAAAFAEKYPTARIASSEQQVLDDPDVRLVATAAIASERAPIGLRAI